MPEDKKSEQLIQKSGTFPEQPKVDSDVIPASTMNNAPQSMLDSISEQAASEQDQDLKTKKRFFTLPKITIDTFIIHNRLKRKAKLAIFGYMFVIFGPLLYGIYTNWKTYNVMIKTWEVQENQYVQSLVGINIAEFSDIKSKLDSGVQSKKDPVHSLFTLEQIASEANVKLLNPGYTINSTDKINKFGIKLGVLLRGNTEEILEFLVKIEKVKPLIKIERFDLTTTEADDYQANIQIEYLLTTIVAETEDEVTEKLANNLTVNYPITGVDVLLQRLNSLRTILMEKVGSYNVGKTDLFGI